MSPLESIVCSAVIDNRATDGLSTRRMSVSSIDAPDAFVTCTRNVVAPCVMARTVPCPSTTPISGASERHVVTIWPTSRPRRSMPRTFTAATEPSSISSASGNTSRRTIDTGRTTSSDATCSNEERGSSEPALMCASPARCVRMTDVTGSKSATIGALLHTRTPDVDRSAPFGSLTRRTTLTSSPTSTSDSLSES